MKFALAACMVMAAFGQVIVPTPASPTPPPTSPPLVPDGCFMMGKSFNADTFISQGVQLNGTVPHETAFYSIFTAWLTETCVASSQNFTVAETSSTPPGMGNIRWKVEGVAAKVSNTSHVPGELTLEYSCPLDAQIERDFTINVKLLVYRQTQPYFLPISFTLTKACLPNLAPSGGGSEGWSAGGTFFFVVFLLTTLGCVLGCGVNYVQKGKTGLDIVPGATTCSAFLGKCIREPRYTPQMDYDAPGGDEYGTTYQSDL